MLIVSGHASSGRSAPMPARRDVVAEPGLALARTITANAARFMNR